MSYKLYTDKTETFECEVNVKNASLKNSIARLIVESSDLSLVFNGKIEDGKCIVPIKKLKGLLDENSKGNIKLEMIVEDVYFKPWESDFIVEEHTSVKVKVNEQKQSSNKPIVEIKSVKNNDSTIIKNKPQTIATKEILSLCEKFKINSKNIKNKKTDFVQLIKEYFNYNVEFDSQKERVIKEVVSLLK